MPTVLESRRGIPITLSLVYKIVAEGIGKPETYMMVTLQRAAVSMGGDPSPAVFAEVRSRGAEGTHAGCHTMQRERWQARRSAQVAR